MTNQQGAPEALRPIARYKIGYHTDDWGMRSSTPSGIPDPAGAWVRYEDHIAALADAQQPATHVQNPAEIEHVAGDVSKNGPESNMAQQPAPSAAAVEHGDGFMEAINEMDELRPFQAAPQPSTTPPADSHPAPVLLSDEELCQIEEPYLLNFRIPLGGQYDFARAVEKAVLAKTYGTQAPQPSPTPQADSQPAPQGETNAQLDIDSNSSAPGQQRDVAGSVALGQPVGNGSDQAAGHTGAQGDKLLIVAERNIRSFLRSAVFKSESDREAALNCVDVLWEAASAPADSVTAPVRQGKWTWVPVEPSTAMLVAGNHGQPGDFSALEVWQDMLGALERSFDYTRPVDPPSTTPPAQAPHAGSQQEARPCHVFTVRKAGALTEWEPTSMAFALPDGAHALYTLPEPTPPAQAADSVLEDAGGANWQDISTAPKDGTRFVAVGNNYGLYSETQHTCIAQWFRGCWMEVSDWNEASELKYLTHWMPLPPLPCSAARAAPQPATADAVDALNDYLEAQDALDNHNNKRVNAEPYEKLMHRRNRARNALDAALAAQRGGL